jgi:hypothetical protein
LTAIRPDRIVEEETLLGDLGMGPQRWALQPIELTRWATAAG